MKEIIGHLEKSSSSKMSLQTRNEIQEIRKRINALQIKTDDKYMREDTSESKAIEVEKAQKKKIENLKSQGAIPKQRQRSGTVDKTKKRKGTRSTKSETTENDSASEFTSEDEADIRRQIKRNEQRRKEKRRDREASVKSDDTKGTLSDEESPSRRSRSRTRRHRSRNNHTDIYPIFDSRMVPEFDKFDERSGETLTEYLIRFERYCQRHIRDDEDAWIRVLKKMLSGDTLYEFEALRDSHDDYYELRYKLMKWDKETKELRKRRAKEQFRRMKHKKNESLYLYSVRLEKTFRLAYPKGNVEKSSTLRDKFVETVPKYFGTIINE